MLIHYNILINPPREVPVTHAEFCQFSYYGVASFWCNYRIAIHVEENGDLKLYGNSSNSRAISYWIDEPRFEGLKAFVISKAEMCYFEIPKDHALAITLNKYFKHCFFKI